MRNKLAERLLGTVLEWTDEELKKERPILVALASLKYDEYHQFTPGMKFIESLACWLNQFQSIEERKIAYGFIRNRLIFFSGFEMNHLVDLAYPSIIRTKLLEMASKNLGIPPWKTYQLSKSDEYQELNARSLFLGLSDGARIDRFRRTNNMGLSNEQILPYYDLSKEKACDLKRNLKKALAQIKNKDESEISDGEATFKLLFLLDDFSASGLSMLMPKGDNYSGKLEKIHKLVQGRLSDLNIIDKNEIKVYPVIYVITEKAKLHLEQAISRLLTKEGLGDKISNWEIKAVLTLKENSVFGSQPLDDSMRDLIDNYYDENIMDDHLRKGGTDDVKLGFAGCGLPLVLNHNTPNDSLFLLWSYGKFKGLFPRASRHKGGLNGDAKSVSAFKE
ncbi:MAG: hypothetical protein APF81_05900 [Desulfosporosinus sp. BRH_c37]|nr:MAG: hypothetical protein APF81_05900 [Desulfosporosinus sp. BRH_c37]